MEQKIKDLIEIVESYKTSLFSKDDVLEMLNDLLNDSSTSGESANSASYDMTSMKGKLRAYLEKKLSEFDIADFVNPEDTIFDVDGTNKIIIKDLSIDNDLLAQALSIDIDDETDGD